MDDIEQRKVDAVELGTRALARATARRSLAVRFGTPEQVEECDAIIATWQDYLLTCVETVELVYGNGKS